VSAIDPGLKAGPFKACRIQRPEGRCSLQILQLHPIDYQLLLGVAGGFDELV
jgi:hypothetical protein